MNTKRFARSRNAVVFGVCAGLAEYLGMDATLMRVLWCLVAIPTMLVPAVILYFILMFVMEAPDGERTHQVDGRKLSLWFSSALILFGLYLIVTAVLRVNLWFFVPVAMVVAGALLMASAFRSNRK